MMFLSRPGSLLGLAYSLALPQISSGEFLFNQVVQSSKPHLFGTSYDAMRTGWNTEPITDVTSTTMRCNTNDDSYLNYVIVKAGSRAGFRIVLDQRQGDSNITAPGPTSLYLAKMNYDTDIRDILTWKGDGNVWFKIAEYGVKEYTPYGAQFETHGKKQVLATIPKSIPTGPYMLRIEHIGLQKVASGGPAEFYVSCAWLWVANGGDANPPTVSIPGHIAPDHPGLTVDISNITSYSIPGPAVWKE